ncbi:MAG: ribosome small subunit-dependent GTPase A [Syntrophomonadaceae bacterium]|nr:ribosome small subunit-dependent GTPase A [Syntrophomonadaceae bacterium]MDD3888341.1 ribosome small subunit-dependent GTPase A [Syntrophomonadaceae bacterium]MDD4548848.1 ribosome small subunit-dependent GTPase A [Syntrophomonadaceae bacterium]
MTGNQLEGVIFKKYSGYYYVQDQEKNIYECKIRGKIKNQVLAGDKAVFTPLEKDKGILEEILPRKNEMYRPRIANVDIVLIIMAHDRPAPSLVLLDRLLFLAQYNKLIPYIILNKCDLQQSEKASMLNDYYPKAGFNFIRTSTMDKTGLSEIKEIIAGTIAVFAGPSGVGKSSLLNALLDGHPVKTQEVSKKIGRGKHTTRHVEIYPVGSSGWIADTPGFSVIDMPDVSSNNVAEYFPDFKEFTAECRFNNCLHYKEKDCGVKDAVAKGIIAEFRYSNYLTMLDEVIQNERCYR